MSDQIPLFDLAPEVADDPSVAAVARVHEEARAIASDLPDDIRFGTSSWSFPGWKGIVYSGAVSSSAIAKDGLRQYASHPLLRTVGIDRSYYAPIPIDDLRRYAEQLPKGFQGAKAPARVTSTIIGPPGSDTPNPDFMSVDRMIDEQLQPFSLAFRDHVGPFVLEFPPFPRSARMAPADFLARLDRFLERLPRDFQYAVELRDERLLTPEYRRHPGAPRHQPYLQLLERDARTDGANAARPARGSALRRDSAAVAAWKPVSGPARSLRTVQRPRRARCVDATGRRRSERSRVDQRPQALGARE